MSSRTPSTSSSGPQFSSPAPSRMCSGEHRYGFPPEETHALPPSMPTTMAGHRQPSRCRGLAGRQK
eukprot:8306388-Alexandrium_andersonii.AAC.1